jgi:hypothetical protein
MNAAGGATAPTIIVNGARIELIDRGHGSSSPILISVSIRRRRCSQCWPKVDG